MIFDLIRIVAALMVLVGHTLGIFPIKGLSSEWSKQIGVVIFFLLSGYLISQTLHRRLSDPNSRFIDYAIDRWSRIYSGFLPAIILVAAMDYFCITHFNANGETIERFTISGFFANLAMLQVPSISLPFGSAAPFWTVAIEFWIYMFVGLIAFLTKSRITLFTAVTLVAIVLTGIIPVQSLTENNAVLVPWLLGALSQQIIASRGFQKVPIALLWLAAVMALCLLAFNIFESGIIYSNYVYALTATIFAATLVIYFRADPRIPKWFANCVRWSANWSYSLYLLHHSILIFTATTTINWSFHNRVICGVSASIIVSIFFASLTEVHHRSLARYIKSIIGDNKIRALQESEGSIGNGGPATARSIVETL